MAMRAGTSRIHLIAPTTADFHDVNVEGRSGILATCGRDPRPAPALARQPMQQMPMAPRPVIPTAWGLRKNSFFCDIADPARSLRTR
jgi:hypothetical protein